MEKYGFNKDSKYYIQTFGCQMNVHESEKIAGVLQAFGFTETKNLNEASIVTINTCAIRESAEKKIESFIGNLKALKKSGILKYICIMGCMTQQQEVASKLKQKFPYINLIIGTHNLPNFKELFLQSLQSKQTKMQVDNKRNGALDLDGAYRTSGVNAYVNISFGCNNYCTYCIVPYVRGAEISRPMQDIIAEVKDLLNQGYKQITLLGQNVNSYGNDIDDPNVSFAKLVKKLDELDYKFRLRFMTSHPKDLSDELIDVIKNSKHICHGIHLPVQSGSTNILQQMNRKYTREHYLELIKKIKQNIPDVGLTTDIIVGFPGETEEDFNDTLSLIKKVGYQQIFGFIYSRRKGTVADTMQNQIPLATKKERLARLIELERQIASNISNNQVGMIQEVLIEGENKGYLIGSNDQNKNVNIKMPQNATNLIGEFVKVKITGSKLTVLYAEIV